MSDNRTTELRRMLDEFERDLCHAGCGVKCETYTERKELLDGVKDRYVQAISAWNTRAERTCHEAMVDKYFRGCSECGYMWEYMYRIGKCERPNYCPNCGARVIKSDQYL